MEIFKSLFWRKLTPPPLMILTMLSSKMFYSQCRPRSRALSGALQACHPCASSVTWDGRGLSSLQCSPWIIGWLEIPTHVVYCSSASAQHCPLVWVSFGASRDGSSVSALVPARRAVSDLQSPSPFKRQSSACSAPDVFVYVFFS